MACLYQTLLNNGAGSGNESNPKSLNIKLEEIENEIELREDFPGQSGHKSLAVGG